MWEFVCALSDGYIISSLGSFGGVTTAVSVMNMKHFNLLNLACGFMQSTFHFLGHADSYLVSFNCDCKC